MTAEINGLQLYYKKTGNGAPIILVHGNGEDHTIFDPLAEQLSEKFTVYALDSRGHGKSSPVSAFDYGDMMEDVAGFIHEMGIEKPLLLGFSDGGIIGLLLEIAYPELLSGLVACGPNTHPKAMKRRFRFLFRTLYLFTRDPKIKLMLEQPQITSEQLQSITTPTLVVAGEKDMFYEEETRAIAKNIAGSRLKIMPGHSHVSYVTGGDALYREILPFLEGLQ